MDYAHNDAVQQKYASSLNTYTKSLLGTEFTFKSTRAIWVAVSMDIARQPNESPAAYRARVLGHAGGDKSTQEHYEGFQLSQDVATIMVNYPPEEQASKTSLDTLDSLLLQHLKQTDRSNWNPRAKAWHSIQDWLILQLENGVSLMPVINQLQHEISHGIVRGNTQATFEKKMANYVRGEFFPDGKKLGAPTAAGWASGALLNEWAEQNLEAKKE